MNPEWMAFDWLVASSSRSLLMVILFMVIGSCFNQFTPTNDVISFLCVISIDSFVVSPWYSMFPHTFSKKRFSFLFTSWYLFFNSWMSFCPYNVGLVGNAVTLFSSFRCSCLLPYCNFCIGFCFISFSFTSAVGNVGCLCLFFVVVLSY